MLSPLVSMATAVFITCPCWRFWKNNRAWLKRGRAFSHPPFLERPIWPSLGALCPSLWGLAASPRAFTWGWPGLYWSAGSGCRGGPPGGMSSGMPEAPYISGVCGSADWPLDVPRVHAESRAVRGADSLPQFNHERTNNRAQRKTAKEHRGESPRSLWME